MRKKKTTSKQKEVSRYALRKRREAALYRKRSKAAKLGRETRRKNERKRKRKKKIRIPTHREWMILIDYNIGHAKFKADLWMVSFSDADSTQLADQARRQLTSGKKFLANWFEGGFSEITKGTLTSEPKQTRIRSFKRH